MERLLSTSDALVKKIDEAYKRTVKDHPCPDLTECHDAFARGLIEYRDCVLKDLVINAAEGHGTPSSKVGKTTEWGNKQAWKKPPSSVGTSSKMSVVPEHTDGLEQTFADDSEEAPETPKPPEPIAEQQEPKKRTRIVRRPRASLNVGSTLSDFHQAALRSCIYYASLSSETSTKQESISTEMQNSLDSNTITHKDVLTIVQSADLDKSKFSVAPEESLGIETGAADDRCVLPKVISKLIE